MDMEIESKLGCNMAIYYILENGPDYSYDGGNCTIDYIYNLGHETYQGCDCSDPKNYNFYDKGRF